VKIGIRMGESMNHRQDSTVIVIKSGIAIPWTSTILGTQALRQEHNKKTQKHIQERHQDQKKKARGSRMDQTLGDDPTTVNQETLQNASEKDQTRADRKEG
jgi:hypothetical protein